MDDQRGQLGTVDGLSFSGFENLTSAAAFASTFVFTSNGSLSGVVDGGADNLGTVDIEGGSFSSSDNVATGPHSGTISSAAR